MVAQEKTTRKKEYNREELEEVKTNPKPKIELTEV